MAQLGTVRSSVVAVAHNPRLLRLESAYALFTVYEMGLWVAVLLWAYQLGGTPFAGLVSVLQYVPSALFAPLGGIVAARVPGDVALRRGYAAQGLSITVLAVLLSASAPRAAVVAAAVVSCALIAWTRPPHYAAATELSRTPADASAANSLSGTLEHAGYCVGPLLAGLSASLGSPTLAVGVCAVMAFVGALLLVGMRLEPAGPSANPEPLIGPAARLTTELRRQPAVAAVLLVIGIEFLADGCLELLAVSFVNQHLTDGAAAAGLLIAAQGLGGVLGAAGAIVLIRWRRLSVALSGALIVCAVPLLTFPSIGRLGPAVGVLVVVGMGMAFFGVAGITLLQRALADAQMTPILALRESAMLGGLAVGAGITPLLVRAFGPATAYAVVGITLAALAVAAVPAVLRLDAAGIYRPELVRLLRGINFLAVLDVAALERLAHGANETEVGAGCKVVREGEQGDQFYVVAAGELVVTVEGQSGSSLLGPGSGFGEIALLRQVPRTATVKSLTACRLWQIDRELFLSTVAGSSGHDIAERHVDAQLRHLSMPDPI